MASTESDRVSVIAMPPEVANMLWDEFKDHLALAVIEHPGETIEDLERLRTRVRTGTAMILQIWDGLELSAVALIEFQDLRDGKCLHVRYLSGNGMDGWLDELHQRLGEIARVYDCEWIGLTGRMGWRKALAKLDYNPVAIQLRARVS